MIGKIKTPQEVPSARNPQTEMNSDLILHSSDLLPGDVLLYRPRNPNNIQRGISKATNSPYTHAAIYLGDGCIAESGFPLGVARSALERSLRDSQCVAVLRSQLVFGDDRPTKLNEFVTAVLKEGNFYDFIGVLNFRQRSANYFMNQLEFIRNNYGTFASKEEFAKKYFFCSAFVVACYAIVGIIGESAQVAYQPSFFSPGHLYQDPTFGWLLGYLLPEDGSIPPDDPPLSQATLWRDNYGARWW
jgi:hypothetical protein